MPVRSLHSPILIWPDRAAVDAAARAWVREAAARHPEAIRIGYFGSYARGDWGVGSDLDVVAVVDPAPDPFIERARRWDTTGIPVDVDIFVYTEEELAGMRESRFAAMLAAETVWIYERC